MKEKYGYAFIVAFIFVPITGIVASSKTCCGVPGSVNSNGRISGGSEAVPHEFPWIVRISGGPQGCAWLCGGALISRKVILSALHCVTKSGSKIICDHSDEKRKAIVGRHIADPHQSYPSDTIPIVKAKAPGDREHHDFVLLVLKRPVTWSKNISPICLPSPRDIFVGKKAVAAGWGQYNHSNGHGSPQSKFLQKVTLKVLPHSPAYSLKYLLTRVGKKRDTYMDPCAGDSGGPLMYFDRKTKKWILIGTVSGGGYDCRTDSVFDDYQGVWNNVTSHLPWIKRTMKDLKEPLCKDN